MNSPRLVITEPSGNTTAIVFGIDYHHHNIVARELHRKFPVLEQILFAHKHKENNSWHGEMAGGEFCGNAARSLGFVLSMQSDFQNQIFTMSGINKPITVTSSGNKSSLSITTDIRQTTSFLGGAIVSLIHMEGISHAIFFNDHPLFNYMQRKLQENGGKKFAISTFNSLGLTTQLACGLIFVDRSNDSSVISPYVFVRKTGTFHAETACASGSIAVASVIGHNIRLKQPSEEYLDISIRQRENDVTAEVEGRIRILYDGHLGINLPTATRHSRRAPYIIN